MNEEDVQLVFEKLENEMSLQQVFEKGGVGSRAVWSTVTELMLLLSPLLLVAFVLAVLGATSASDFLGRSDISLLATFVFGQAAIKAFQFPQDVFILKGNEVMSGLVAIVICFGMLPSAALFSVVVVSQHKLTSFLWLQPFLLAVSIVTYAFFAFVSNAANVIKLEGSKTMVARAIDKLNGAK